MNHRHQWIAVEDRLPPEGVFVMAGIRDCLPLFLRWTGERWEDQERSWGMLNRYAPVYWMPLPSPPPGWPAMDKWTVELLEMDA